MNRGGDIRQHNEPAFRNLCKRIDCTFNFGRIVNGRLERLNGKRASSTHERREIGSRNRYRIEHNCDLIYGGSDPFEYFEPLAVHRGIKMCEARNVAAWMRNACNESRFDRVGYHHKYDRDAVGRLLQRSRDSWSLT